VWYVWPIRYFFYYRFISCGVSDPLAARCADGVNGAAVFCGAVDATFASNNVFYVNMLAHGAILMVCCNVAYLMTMLKALNVTHKGNKEAGKKTKDSTYTTGTRGILHILRLCAVSDMLALSWKFLLCYDYFGKSTYLSASRAYFARGVN
jgi:hypothetical protein